MTTKILDLANMRRSYEKDELHEDSSDENPFLQFKNWFETASNTKSEPEAAAMTLATVGSDMRPSTRIVLLKGFDDSGLTFFTNYESKKGQEIAGNPQAAIQFHWHSLEQVIRIEGIIEKISDADSDAYYKSRPLDSKIGAWASPQSQVIKSRTQLVTDAAKWGAKFLLNPPRPPHWGGYKLKPDYWEFWQGRKSRLHDRLVYTFENDKWTRQRLAP